MPNNGAQFEVICPDGSPKCPWCDGTGKYARAAPLNADTVWVPCGYCKATGVRAA